MEEIDLTELLSYYIIIYKRNQQIIIMPIHIMINI